MKMIVLNHKMNLNYDEVKKYIKAIGKYKDQVIVLPSSIYINEFINNNFNVGIQNIYYGDNGFYTGEISASQAKSLGIKYVLIGHSERRIIFKETDELINKKIKSALANDLKVILCIGDNLSEDANDVLYKQITNGLKDIDKEIIIAYEPVYAIGTGLTPSIEEIEKRITYIKSLAKAKVLYGGSININNIKALNKIKNLDGYLIGKASLNSSELLKILEVVV